MKTIGMIGGTGWVSTLEYYRLLNEEIGRRLGGHNAARCILYSLNFADIVRLKEMDPEQQGVRQLVIETAATLAAAGAECLALCANTLHWFAADIEKAVPLPLVHIATATGEAIRNQGLAKVGLLGTRPTMEKDFYRQRLLALGIETLVPDSSDRVFVDQAVMNELIHGRFELKTRANFLEIIDSLAERGAQGIILGCTEIPLLIKQADTALPLFDTLSIHARAIAAFALANAT